MVSFFIAALSLAWASACFQGFWALVGGTVMVPLFRLAFGMEPIAATALRCSPLCQRQFPGMWKLTLKQDVPAAGGNCVRPDGCVPLAPLACGPANVSPGWAIMGAAAVVVMYSSFTMLKRQLAAPKWWRSEGSRKACEKKSDGERHGGGGCCRGDRRCSSGKPRGDGACGGGRLGGAAGAQAALSRRRQSSLPQIRGEGGAHWRCCRLRERICGRGRRFHYGAAIREHARNSHALASGTSLTAVCILAIPGVIEQAVLGNIDYMVGVAMMVGSIPGAIVGANLVKRARSVAFCVCAILLLMAVLLVVNEASVI